MLETNFVTQGNTVIFSISGRVDSTNATLLDQKIAEAEPAENFILDIEKLEYISSAGLRIILKYRKTHPFLELINASTEVYEILDMTGFTEMMTVKRAYRTVSVEGCEVIGRGANGEVYRIDPDTVVKVYLNPDSLEDIEHERDVARKALVLGIPTAISYDVVKVGDHYASMFEMLNAKSFSKLLIEAPENIDQYAKMYVDLLKLIHSTKVPAGQLPDQRLVFLGWIKDLENHLPKDVFEKFYAMAEAIPFDDHMIHGDYHTKNIMLQNDEVILIDMDTLAIGHPVLEFASIYNAYLGFSAVDHENIKGFLGFDYETGTKFFEKTLKLYYETEENCLLETRANQAKAAGLIRLLRRTLRRDKNPAMIDYCTKELCNLAKLLTSFTE